ncbi:unnamed protein product [Spirodela intermedia]|uniref:Uncharacterized protein n=1 Tax=Spirodela intermedia TaxID=51605 RepID=A0A7I8JF71_SPIIN|nr:unnamed protein product [Spirodela intermedia]CAA6668800.1 unnamed protein product [Spirodela intermedia]
MNTSRRLCLCLCRHCRHAPPSSCSCSHCLCPESSSYQTGPSSCQRALNSSALTRLSPAWSA